MIASASTDNTIMIWDPEDSFECYAELTGHKGFINLLILLNDGKIASGSSDCTVKIWNTADEFKLVASLNGHTHGINCLIQLSDGRIAT